MHALIQLKRATSLFLIVLGFVWLGLLPKAQAVTPAPDGGYPGGNTAEGQAALLSLTTGGFNTAVGFLSLRSNTTNSFNTAIGAGALLANTADLNTATGAGALLSNTTGQFNTANGALALFSNKQGSFNNAVGIAVLMSNLDGINNNALGADALSGNIHASNNTAIGDSALLVNDSSGNGVANGNTAVGSAALFNNEEGASNNAVGQGALGVNTTGNQNTAEGFGALGFNTTGNNNVALGMNAGANATTGSNNVYIGTGMEGVAGESNACYIASIFGQTSANGVPVLINSSNKLGTITSSKRFKEEIKPMDKASQALLALNPVTFRYKKEIDPTRTSQFGLVAEDVDKVNPDLVVRDKAGKPYSVRYDAVNAMLLNEFLKEHRTVQEQGATIARQQKQIDALTAGLQKVSAQLEVNKPAPQTVLNKQH
jgi:hypothetical protein